MDIKYENYNVLFVDDENNILKSIRRGLFEEEYNKLYASGGPEALEIMKETPISVLVTDMRMPEMSGLDLLKITQEKYPDTVRIILTGYAQISTLISAINSGQVFRYLTKPWKLNEEFKPAIRGAIDYFAMLQEKKEILKKLKTKNLELNKQNLEIKALMKEKQIVNIKKSEIIDILSKSVIPFISHVIQTTSTLTEGNNPKPASETRDDLKSINNRGLEIFELLLKIESLIK